jgi:enoyl-[acyl-carrier-protein] reductase (NADH)
MSGKCVQRGSTMLDPQRIADAALYLNSDLASNVTGISLPVESGHLLIPGWNNEPIRD